MQVGIRYIVTLDSENKEFQVGDRIWLLKNGGIMCSTVDGWMPAESVPEATRGMEIEIDSEWCEEKRVYFEKMMAKLDAAIAGLEKLK
jgi:hypothetical protein